MNVTDYMLPETFCHSQKVFKWMRENVGYKHIHWDSKITVSKVNGARQLQFHIHDEGVRALFKLTFGDHFTKLDIKQYFDVFFIRLPERVRLLQIHTE